MRFNKNTNIWKWNISINVLYHTTFFKSLQKANKNKSASYLNDFHELLNLDIYHIFIICMCLKNDTFS